MDFVDETIVCHGQRSVGDAGPESMGLGIRETRSKLRLHARLLSEASVRCRLWRDPLHIHCSL